jgi:glycine/D-amino acid oxidase-like deaminating enzyme
VAAVIDEAPHAYRGLSLWWDQVGEPAPRMPLDGDTEADVVIVGAGYTGLWTAYYLLRADPSQRVVVLDSETAGFGASGRNGGWCSGLFPTSLDRVARAAGGGPEGRAAAIAQQHAAWETVEEVGRVIRDEGIDVGWAHGGAITLARNPVQLARADAEVHDARRWGGAPGDDVLLDEATTRARVNASDAIGATWTPHCAVLHPARLVRGLADVVERTGATVHDHTRVTAIEPRAARTNSGTVHARHVIRATEGYTPQLPGQRRALVPVYSLVIATEPLADDVWQQIGLHRREAFTDHGHLVIYGQRTADDRLVFGGRGAPYHYGSNVRPEFDREPAVFAALHATLLRLFPALHGAAITHTWGGPLGVPRDWFPSVGLDRATGIGRAGGYVGDGVAAANLAGRTLADLVLGNDTELVRLPWVDHRSRRWEPEPLRWLGVNAGLRVMTVADRTEARTGRPSRTARLATRLMKG